MMHNQSTITDNSPIRNQIGSDNQSDHQICEQINTINNIQRLQNHLLRPRNTNLTHNGPKLKQSLNSLMKAVSPANRLKENQQPFEMHDQESYHQIQSQYQDQSQSISCSFGNAYVPSMLPLTIAQNKEPLSKKITQLVVNLIELLKQLCLSATFCSQVLRSLSPFVINHRTLTINSAQGNGKCMKTYLQNFFAIYLSLLKAAIQKISKYNCDKKLKYLIQTIVKQIFNQIMRISYQVKIQFSGLSRNWQRMSITMLNHKLKTLFRQKGHVLSAFKKIKRQVQQQQRADEKFVYRFQKKLMKIQSIHRKFSKKVKSIYLHKWRVQTLMLEQDQNILIAQFGNKLCSQLCFVYLSNAENFIHSNSWKNKFMNGVNQLLQMLVKSVQSTVTEKQENCSSSLNFILNPEPYRSFKNIHSQCKPKITPRILQTYRNNQTSISSQISDDNSYHCFDEKNSVMKQFCNYNISQVPQEIIRICIQSGEIQNLKNCQIRQQNGVLSSCRLQGKNSRALIIPIRASGVIQIRWQTNLDLTLLKIVLKIVQQYSDLIFDAFLIGSKIDYLQSSEVNGSWQKECFQQFTRINNQAARICKNNAVKTQHSIYKGLEKKVTTLKTTKQTQNAFLTDQSHLQQNMQETQYYQRPYGQRDCFNHYNQISEEQSYLEQDIVSQQCQRKQDYNQQIQRISKQKNIKYWMDMFNISSFSLYHSDCYENKPSFNQQGIIIKPCCQLNDPYPFSVQIVESIAQEIRNKFYTKIRRNGVDIHILKIQEGFCKVIPYKNEVNIRDYQAIKQCFIPLLYKSFSEKVKIKGETLCKQCLKVQRSVVKDTFTILNKENIQKFKLEATQIKRKPVETSHILNLLASSNIIQMQKNIYQAIRQSVSQQKMFARMIYNLNSQNDTYWILKQTSGSRSHKIIELPSLPINPLQNQVTESNPYYSYLSSLLKENPLFDNLALKLYEAQHKESLRIMYLVSKKGVLLMGYFQNKKALKQNNQKSMKKYETYLKTLKTVSNAITFNKLAMDQGDIMQWIASRQYDESSSRMIEKFNEKISHNQNKSNSLNDQSVFKNIQLTLQDKVQKLFLGQNNAAIKVLKIDSIKSAICDLNTQQLFTLEKDIKTIKQLVQQPFCSHAKVTSKHYFYSRKNHQNNSKIKSVMANIPNFSSSQQQSLQNFTQFAERKFKLEGTIINQRFQKIKQIFKLQEQSFNQEYGFMFFPIYQCDILVIIPIRLSDLVLVDKQLSELIEKYISKTVASLIKQSQNAKRSQIKNSIENILMPLHKKNILRRKKQAIASFRKLLITKNNAINQIVLSLEKYRKKTNLRFYSFGMSKMICQSLVCKANMSKKLEQFQRKIQRSLMSSLFKKIQLQFYQKQKLMKIEEMFAKKIKSILKRGMQYIKTASYVKKQSTSNKKQQSCYRIFYSILEKTNQNQRSLWRKFEAKQRQMKELEKLIKQEYEISNGFNTQKKFIQFTKDRIGCGLAQINKNISGLQIAFINDRKFYLSKEDNRIVSVQQLRENPNWIVIAIGSQVNEMLCLKIQSHQAFKQMNREKIWLQELARSTLVQSYKKYLNLVRIKSSILLKTIPSVFRFSFNKLKSASSQKQIGSLFENKQEKSQKQRQYEMLEVQYKSALKKAEDQNSRANKSKIKDIKQGLVPIQQKENQLMISYQIKRKTNATYRMLHHLDRKRNQNQSSFNSHTSNCKNIQNTDQQYAQVCNTVNKMRQTTKARAARLLNIKIKRICQIQNKNMIKEAFVRVWKSTKSQTSYRCQKILDLIR